MGVTVDVALEGSGLDEAEFRRLWHRTLEAPDGWESGAFASLAIDAPASLESATQRITRQLVELQWGNLLMLHAGAVADPSTGRTLAYVAPSGTGKSTLTRLLGREFGYVTDETVGVAPQTLAVLPYPKPITWAEERGARKVEHAPESMGLQVCPPRPHLARLAVLRRTGIATPTFTELSTVEAIEAVAPETSSLAMLPSALHLLASVFERVRGVTLIEYGEATDILDWCRAALAEPAEGATPAPGSDTPPAAFGPVHLYEDDEASLLLLGTTLLRLSPVAAAIVRQWPSPVDELAASLAAEFGPPEGVDLISAVEEQLAALAERGAITR